MEKELQNYLYNFSQYLSETEEMYGENPAQAYYDLLSLRPNCVFDQMTADDFSSLEWKQFYSQIRSQFDRQFDIGRCQIDANCRHAAESQYHADQEAEKKQQLAARAAVVAAKKKKKEKELIINWCIIGGVIHVLLLGLE